MYGNRSDVTVNGNPDGVSTHGQSNILIPTTTITPRPAYILANPFVDSNSTSQGLNAQSNYTPNLAHSGQNRAVSQTMQNSITPNATIIGHGY